MTKKVIFFFFFCFFSFSASSTTITGYANVVDGDTIYLQDNKIRFFGIDAPEKKQNCKKIFFTISFISFSKTYKCGEFSTQKLKKFIENKKIKCITKEKDFYDRYIATCYLKKTDINSWMVRNGFAIAYRKYSKKYVMDEENQAGDQWREEGPWFLLLVLPLVAFAFRRGVMFGMTVMLLFYIEFSDSSSGIRMGHIVEKKGPAGGGTIW